MWNLVDVVPTTSIINCSFTAGTWHVIVLSTARWGPVIPEIDWASSQGTFFPAHTITLSVIAVKPLKQFHHQRIHPTIEDAVEAEDAEHC